MSNFNCYEIFLGIKSPVQVVVNSENRNLPLDFYYYFPLICSKYNSNMVYSVATKYFYEFEALYNEKNKFKGLDKSQIIGGFFKNKFTEYNVEVMYRMFLNVKKFESTELNNEVKQMKLSDKDIFLTFLSEYSDEIKEEFWDLRKERINKGFYFALEEKKQIVSFAYITDIISGVANISVVTKDGYRNKGYASSVVSQLVKWSLSRNIIPSYWVSKENLSSIKLAIKLGFEVKAEEIVVSIFKSKMDDFNE